ncbi:MAG: DUF1460 domain-containing protein [Gammaproteobacteria bacterium]|nr:DUF1460 domain-containing protein [Gammaproteobacteria bacterium]
MSANAVARHRSASRHVIHAYYRRLARPVAAIAALLALASCDSGSSVEEARLLALSEGTAEDWGIVRSTLARAWDEELHRLPLGETMARIGVTFVGTAYVPQTLEVEGPERLVVNLRELDCVTFVENVLALGRFVHLHDPSLLDDETRLRAEYRRLLTEIRYRGGELEGYPSRLHYFSEWIADNGARGLVRDISRELGGMADDTPINFMSTHPDAYRQLSEPGIVDEIARAEARLGARPRYFIGEAHIEDAAPGIANGDIIAATSTVDGLDIAHTGLALVRDGGVFLLHAPLVGSAVQISEVPLAERVQRIGGQDGIMVARPLEPGTVGGDR